MSTMKRLPVMGIGLLLTLGGAAHGANERKPDVVAIGVQTAPKIDGVLDDAAWTEVAKDKRGVLDNWHPWDFSKALDKPLAQPRTAYVCYDQDRLYVGMKASVSDIYKLKAGANAFAGDCLEIHLKTPEGTYFQLGIDFEGTLTLGEVPAGADLKLLRGNSELGSNSWSTEVAIPWQFLGITPKPGLRFGFNLAANYADQGLDTWTPITWGKSFFVRHNETLLELQ
jgi:hypothetical protein